MALHLTPTEHDADPPAKWGIRKSGRRWALTSTLYNGAVLRLFDTKRDAEAARTSGDLARLYNDEGRWFRGESVNGWKPYTPGKGQ